MTRFDATELGFGAAELAPRLPANMDIRSDPE